MKNCSLAETVGRLYTLWCISDFYLSFCLERLVLQLLKSAQMQHGLRHGDYTRYRCSVFCYLFLMKLDMLLWVVIVVLIRLAPFPSSLWFFDLIGDIARPVLGVYTNLSKLPMAVESMLAGP